MFDNETVKDLDPLEVRIVSTMQCGRFGMLPLDNAVGLYNETDAREKAGSASRKSL